MGDDDGAHDDYLTVIDVNETHRTYGQVLSTSRTGSRRNDPQRAMDTPFRVEFQGTAPDAGSTYRDFWPVSGPAGNRTWIYEITDLANPVLHAILGPGGRPAGPTNKWPFGWDQNTTIAPNGKLITALWGLQGAEWGKVHNGPIRATPGALMGYDYLGSIKRVFPAFDPTRDYTCSNPDPAVDLHCTLNPYALLAYRDKGVLLSTDHSDPWSLGTAGVQTRFRNTVRVWQYHPTDATAPVLRQTLALPADPTDPTSNLAVHSLTGTIVQNAGLASEMRFFFASTAEGGGVYRCTFAPAKVPAFGAPNDPANPIIDCGTRPFFLAGFGATFGSIAISPPLAQAGNHRYLVVAYGKNNKLLYLDLGADGVEVSGPARQVAAIDTDQTPTMLGPANSFGRVYISHHVNVVLDRQIDGSRKIRRLDLSYDPDGGVTGRMVPEACFSVDFKLKLDGGSAVPGIGGGRPHALIAVPAPMPVILP